MSIQITSHLANLASTFGVVIPKNIVSSIAFSITNDSRMHKHIAFLINKKTRQIIGYEHNVYYNTQTFPFSQHAEARLVNKFNKNKLNTKDKKIVFVVKLSKHGLTSNSKPCRWCFKALKDSMKELNIKEVYYSISTSEVESIKFNDVNLEDFKISKGFSKVLEDNEKDKEHTIPRKANKKTFRRGINKGRPMFLSS